MADFFTADTHFEHGNILTFCKNTRGHFKDIGEMREVIIREWNITIKPEDTVYILGDVAFTNAKTAVGILNRLNGNKILIKGNHDRKLLKDIHFVNAFVSVHDYLQIKSEDYNFILFHYPIWEWDQCHRDYIHLHGHVHGKPTGIPGRILDVGLDSVGMKPISATEIIRRMKNVPNRTHH